MTQLTAILCRLFGHRRVLCETDVFRCPRCKTTWPVSGGWPPLQLPIPPNPRPPLVTVEESSVPPGVPFNIQYDERGHMRCYSITHYPAVEIAIADCIDA